MQQPMCAIGVSANRGISSEGQNQFKRNPVLVACRLRVELTGKDDRSRVQ